MILEILKTNLLNFQNKKRKFRHMKTNFVIKRSTRLTLISGSISDVSDGGRLDDVPHHELLDRLVLKINQLPPSTHFLRIFKKICIFDLFFVWFFPTVRVPSALQRDQEYTEMRPGISSRWTRGEPHSRDALRRGGPHKSPIWKGSDAPLECSDEYHEDTLTLHHASGKSKSKLKSFMMMLFAR